ncbi:MAG: hypothetical protein HS110_06320 [Zoogloeaceae bacterium]|nr:hypothetical protein [Zoogloeaceae bacterium]
MIGITIDFQARLACPSINRPAAGEEIVFFPADRLVRMTNTEFKDLARRRRQAPKDLLREILMAAVKAAQRVLDQGGEDVRGRVLRLLCQGEALPGRDGALHFEVLV